MILRPLESPSAAGADFQPAWTVVERLQRQSYDGCWMITQPSHAALAGELAAKITHPAAPSLDADLVRAIALHDAGWGVPDAQAIMQSRSVRQGCPRSFIACSVNEFLTAWEKSIDIAGSAGPAGGYIVSRHFWRLGANRVAHSDDIAGDRNQLNKFLASESKRQEQLKARQSQGAAELEALTDVLQFCDLLSLYICSGAKENAVFPQYF
ncbi:MAG TPA: DUF3891 family protein, partial [Candidatus Angelobacter sp.]|nr:DUF3891 family protein [Candidatus Angelobacter sp.]